MKISMLKRSKRASILRCKLMWGVLMFYWISVWAHWEISSYPDDLPTFNLVIMCLASFGVVCALLGKK